MKVTNLHESASARQRAPIVHIDYYRFSSDGSFREHRVTLIPTLQIWKVSPCYNNTYDTGLGVSGVRTMLAIFPPILAHRGSYAHPNRSGSIKSSFASTTLLHYTSPRNLSSPLGSLASIAIPPLSKKRSLKVLTQNYIPRISITIIFIFARQMYLVEAAYYTLLPKEILSLFAVKKMIQVSLSFVDVILSRR